MLRVKEIEVHPAQIAGHNDLLLKEIEVHLTL
jgi:hypothetical protein